LRRIVDKFQKFKRTIDRARGRRDIDVLLANADPYAPLADRVVWLQQIILWLRSSARAEDREAKKRSTSRSSAKRIETVRLKFIFQLLDRNPDWKPKVAGTLRAILSEASALELFSLTGLTREPSFFLEASNRMFRRFLPSSSELHDLGPIFNLIFVHGDDDTWVETLPRELVEQVIALISHNVAQESIIYANLKADMFDSLSLLGTMIGSIGMSHDLRLRMTNKRIVDSPFRLLAEKLFEISDRLRTNAGVDPLASPMGTEIVACRERIKDVFAHLEQTGVSVKLVYRLETLNRLLDRVEILLSILIPHPATDHTVVIQKFVADLIREGHDAESIGSLFRRNLDLISRKVVERVGLSGEHYITSSPREYLEMLKAGAGGGLVTVLTTTLKFAISGAHMPLFFEGLFSWLNYSTSFLTMQAAHFALATKQPSMTASALANKLRHLNHRRYLKEFVEEVTRITRSQFAAAVGNVGFVIPGAMIFDFLVLRSTGHNTIDPHYAQKIIHSLNPITSLTIPAAAITGLVLWVAAISGGWLENWSAYHRIPQALATNRRLFSIFGKKGAERISHVFAKEINSTGTNISVGFLLGFIPIAGSFFGAPLDVRHITLSTGALTFAVCSIGLKAVSGTDLAWAIIGLIITLTLNFGVSFALALFVAIRARRIKKLWLLAVARGVLRRFTTKPSQFFFPPRE
jgi:site-specific recombinase